MNEYQTPAQELNVIFNDVANSIRQKSQKVDKIVPSDFSNEITNLREKIRKVNTKTEAETLSNIMNKDMTVAYEEDTVVAPLYDGALISNLVFKKEIEITEPLGNANSYLDIMMDFELSNGNWYSVSGQVSLDENGYPQGEIGVSIMVEGEEFKDYPFFYIKEEDTDTWKLYQMNYDNWEQTLCTEDFVLEFPELVSIDTNSGGHIYGLEQSSLFMGTLSNNFEGLYTYRDNIADWMPTTIGVCTPANVVLEGYKAMTNTGIVEGTLGTAPMNESNNYGYWLLNKMLLNKDNITSDYAGDIFTNYGDNKLAKERKLPFLNEIDWSLFSDSISATFRNMGIEEIDYKIFDGKLREGQVISAKDDCAAECPNLEEIKNIDIYYNNSNVKYFWSITRECPKLRKVSGFDKIDYSKFTAFSVETLFSGPSQIEELDFTNANVSPNGTNVLNPLFNSVDNNLRRLYLPDLPFTHSYNGTGVSCSLFKNLTKLELLDIRSGKFSSTNLTSINFADIPADCLIIVKDDTERNAILNKYRSDFTNIKTVAEYEG